MIDTHTAKNALITGQKKILLRSGSQNSFLGVHKISFLGGLKDQLQAKLSCWVLQGELAHIQLCPQEGKESYHRSQQIKQKLSALLCGRYPCAQTTGGSTSWHLIPTIPRTSMVSHQHVNGWRDWLGFHGKDCPVCWRTPGSNPGLQLLRQK